MGLFLGSFAAFQLVYYGLIISSGAFGAYLKLSARWAAAVLRMFGEPVVVAGDVLASTFSMSIAHGCDGLQAMAILVLAIAWFPVGGRSRLLGIAVGALAVFGLNLARIVTLFWAGVHWPEAFQPLHVHGWPAFLIVFAVLFWIAWATWAVRPVRTA